MNKPDDFATAWAAFVEAWWNSPPGSLVARLAAWLGRVIG